MTAGDYLDVAYTLMVDGVCSGVNAEDVMGRLDALLAEPIGASPLTPNRAEWGTGQRAVDGQRAMMALAGPPPTMPPRPREEADR